VIEVTNVVKRYGATPVLNGATFQIAEAQLTTILGPSGCGKSTMLRCLNRLERFDEGQIRIGDVAVHGTNDAKLSPTEEDELVNQLRMRVGLVFQNFNLFPHLTALENVIEAPMTVKKQSRSQSETIGRMYLKRVGLEGKEDEYPARLSGGQQQRVSIARALVNEPDIVFGDEPTGNLDSETTQEVIELMKRLHREKHLTFILVTHDSTVGNSTERVVLMRNGQILKSFRPAGA
jgi:polar amino acid transport system ATP-binding protein